MNIITLDFETFFDDDYTLSKMTTEQYVRNPRFEAHGVGVRWPDGTKLFYGHERIKYEAGVMPSFSEWAAGVNWSTIAVLCHHAHFDGLILWHHYGIKPEIGRAHV